MIFRPVRRYLLSAAMLFLCTLAFAAPTLLSPYLAGAGKWTLTAASDLVIDPDSGYYSLPSVGIRYGLPDKSEIGLRGCIKGALIDWKIPFLSTFPFTTAVDIEGGYTGSLEISGAVLLEMEVVSFMHVYLSARFRYPSSNALDTVFYGANGGGLYVTGGLELFRKEWISILGVGGMCKSWIDLELHPFAQAMITFKI